MRFNVDLLSFMIVTVSVIFECYIYHMNISVQKRSDVGALLTLDLNCSWGIRGWYKIVARIK